MEKIINLIDKKLVAYREELAALGDYKKDIQTKFTEAKEDFPVNKDKTVLTIAEMLKIGEQVNSLKVAIKVLEDLKKDIVNGV